MNWTTASMESGDNQAQIRAINMNKLTVGGGILSYESIIVGTSIILIATVFFLYFFDPFLMEVFLHYVAPFGPS